MLNQLSEHVDRARAFLAEPNEAADQIEHVDDDERERERFDFNTSATSRAILITFSSRPQTSWRGRCSFTHKKRARLLILLNRDSSDE